MTKKKILVCDDEKGVRESVRLILHDIYDSIYASNGEEVLHSLKKNKADLLIMDIKMPRMGGMETLPRIRRLRPKLPILIMTGYESRDVASEAINRGASDYLTKPFQRERILAKVKALLEKK